MGHTLSQPNSARVFIYMIHFNIMPSLMPRFAFVFDRNFEILILWNSGRDCRVTNAIVSSSN